MDPRRLGRDKRDPPVRRIRRVTMWCRGRGRRPRRPACPMAFPCSCRAAVGRPAPGRRRPHAQCPFPTQRAQRILTQRSQRASASFVLRQSAPRPVATRFDPPVAVISPGRSRTSRAGPPRQRTEAAFGGTLNKLKSDTYRSRHERIPRSNAARTSASETVRDCVFGFRTDSSATRESASHSA